MLPLRYVTLILTLLLLAGFYAEARTHPTRDSAAPFHARIANLASAIPLSFNGWTTSDNTDNIPPSAIKLLRPNVLLGRSCIHDASGARAKIVFVQCQDSRDMGGHYPPHCYTTQGWNIVPRSWPDGEPGEEVTLRVGARTITARVYDFRQDAFPADRHLRIYSFFAIPGHGTASSLPPVRRAAEDYVLRPFGAAQTQIITDGATPESDARRVAEELLAPLLPMIEAVERKDVPEGEGARP